MNWIFCTRGVRFEVEFFWSSHRISSFFRKAWQIVLNFLYLNDPFHPSPQLQIWFHPTRCQSNLSISTRTLILKNNKSFLASVSRQSESVSISTFFWRIFLLLLIFFRQYAFDSFQQFVNWKFHNVKKDLFASFLFLYLHLNRNNQKISKSSDKFQWNWKWNTFLFVNASFIFSNRVSIKTITIVAENSDAKVWFWSLHQKPYEIRVLGSFRLWLLLKSKLCFLLNYKFHFF